MIRLHLAGQLAEDYGKVLEIEAKTPREAVIAMSYQCPKYKEVLESNNWHIFVGENNDITEVELDLQLGSVRDVFLYPVIQGSSGAFNFIVGAVLTVVGVWFGNPYLISMGVGMMLGGIVQMTTKVPKIGTSGDMSRDGADDKSSFLFNGPANTASQGVAIPRGYGRMLVGSIVVSAAIYAEQVGNITTTDVPGLIVGDIWE